MLVLTFGRSEWDMSNRDDLKRLLDKALLHPNVVLDMSAVTYADSTVLNELVKMRQARASRGFGPARIVVPNPQIRRLFKIVGFDRLWRLYRSLEDALADC